MANDFLEKILEHKRDLIQKKENYYNAIKEKIKKDTFSRYHLFFNSISKPGKINLIAEIKKASPSRGLICQDFTPLKFARIYTESGAAALSILTEDKYFLGKPDYIRTVSNACTLPILTKDFIIDEGQIYEAYVCGASAILLIVGILTDEQFEHLKGVASRLDLDCLVEVHDEKELKRAIDLDAEIIGINNRNLRTFEVDFKTCENLIPKVPAGKVIVAESGLQSHEEIKKLTQLGAHAVLIGETFLKAADVAGKIKEVMEGGPKAV